MAETHDNSPQPAKPGTACLGCRRRKLKCSREPDRCSNCAKSDLPCVYPAPERGVKRKRGPYKKDKPARERHLEDLVKYLEPKTTEDGADEGAVPANGGASRSDYPSENASTPQSDLGRRHSSRSGAQRGPGNSEDLVKDALSALTRSSVLENDFVADDANAAAQGFTNVGTRPTIRHTIEYWHLFVTRVDPLCKVIHCRSFEKILFIAIDAIQPLSVAEETLLFSIYYSAASTCTPQEARLRFGESRKVLLQRYGHAIETALCDNYSLPVLESLQALILYIISIRREDTATNLRALFSLAVRMAQLMGLHEDPGEAFPPLQAELRRRVWWHICGLESRGAEEGGARSSSIMEGRHVQLPANLFDVDLLPGPGITPQSRTGVTDTTFLILRLEVIKTVQGLRTIRKRYNAGIRDDGVVDVKSEQRKYLGESKSRLQDAYLQYLHDSRPYDWLCMNFIRLMMIKLRLIIDHPFGQVPTKQMSARERFDLLQSSVEIIRVTHSVTLNRSVEPWHWYFRGWTQWHSYAIVIAELGWMKNKQFASSAWSVLDPILDGWDKIYHMKRDEPAWDHVNALIERARQMRPQTPPTEQIGIPAQQSTQSNQLDGIQGALSTAGQMSAMPNGAYLDALNSEPSVLPPPQNMNWDVSGLSDPAGFGTTDHTGCAATAFDFDVDFGSFADLDNIDFSLFEDVFGDTSWDFSTPSSTGYSAISGTI